MTYPKMTQMMKRQEPKKAGEMNTSELGTEHKFDADRIGQWTQTRDFVVEPERSIAYAAATNDPLMEHLAGTYAPPVFAVVPPFHELAKVSLAAAPEELRMKILHGEQDFRFHRPIVPGEKLSSRAKVIGIHGKSSGTVVTTVATTQGSDGELVNEQYFSGFFRGGIWPHQLGEQAPTHEFDASLRQREPDFTVTQKFDDDQTFRYSGPSGDTMPIHLDDELARKFGLPGIIIHGLCTMAFESHALLAELQPADPARLKRLAVRFANPARPGQTMTTSFWKSGSVNGHDEYSFESVNDEGQPLIKDGFAEIASP